MAEEISEVKQNTTNPNSKSKEPTNKPENSTPRPKTRLELRAAEIKLNRSRVSIQLLRKITLTNCLIDEIKAARQANKSVKNRKHI